jgi:hypothetical protein
MPVIALGYDADIVVHFVVNGRFFDGVPLKAIN